MAALPTHLQKVWQSFLRSSGLESHLLSRLSITSPNPGLITFSLPLEPHHLNRLGSVHGGTIASLVDVGGSLAVASKGLYATGVSTDLNVSFLRGGGKAGEILKGEVTCDKFGKTLAYTSARLFRESGETVARGSHTKFIQEAWKDERNIVDEINKLQ